MSVRSGFSGEIRAAATYAANDTWYACDDAVYMFQNADTIRLYLDCTVDNCGIVMFKIQISDDSGASWYDVEMGTYYGPITLSSGDTKAFTFTCAPLVAADNVKILFKCSEGASSAKLGIRALGYQNGADKNCPSDFFLAVSQGRIPGHGLMHKFGQTGSLTSGTDSDIWSYSATEARYTFSATADIDTISSSDAGDTQDITIVGLDSNWDEVSQTATLNGQNWVTLATPLIRVYRAYNSNSTDLAGNVYVYPQTSIVGGVPVDTSKVRLHIPVGANQTLTSIYTVPRGKTGYLYTWSTSLANKVTASVSVVAQARLFGSVWRTQSTHAISNTGSSNHDEEYMIPLEFPEKTDFRVYVNSSANSVVISSNYNVLLVDNR